VKKIAPARHGGTIAALHTCVTPERKRQMTFVTAPLSPAEVCPTPPKPTILVVEDDPAVQRVFVLWLKELGYQFLTARDGAEALEILFEQPELVDLILCDVIMPKMGGRRFAETLQKRGYEHPLLFVTGYCKDALHDLGIIAPEAELLQKPCDFTTFAAKVEAVLASAGSAACRAA
jgi:CheY-like chemotaxis protein